MNHTPTSSPLLLSQSVSDRGLALYQTMTPIAPLEYDAEDEFERYEHAQKAFKAVKQAQLDFDTACEALDQNIALLESNPHKQEKYQRKIDQCNQHKLESEAELEAALKALNLAKDKLSPEASEAFSEECEIDFSRYAKTTPENNELIVDGVISNFYGVNIPPGVNEVDGIPNTQFILNRSSVEKKLNADDFETDKLSIVSGSNRGIKMLSGKMPNYTCEFPDGTKKTLPLTAELKVNTDKNGIDRVGIVHLSEKSRSLLIGCIPLVGGIHLKSDTKNMKTSAKAAKIKIDPYQAPKNAPKPK